MKHMIVVSLTTLAALLAGCEDPKSKPLDQRRIISVRPAIPDGARSFVEQQEKLHRQRQRKSKTQAAQPSGYTYMEAPPAPKPANANGSWLDIFNPAKWGKPNPSQARQPSQAKQAPAAPAQAGPAPYIQSQQQFPVASSQPS